MRKSHLRGAAIGGVMAAGLAATAAEAHHGWAWVDTSRPFVITGTLLEIYVGNPHVTVELMVEGEQWHVDLAPLTQSSQAGFGEDAAAVGDEATLSGFRSLDSNQRSMKAVRIEVGGVTYDVYPDRTAPFDL